MQFEGEVKIIRSFLSSCRKTVEEARGGGGAYSPDVWRDLKEVCHVLQLVPTWWPYSQLRLTILALQLCMYQ